MHEGRGDFTTKNWFLGTHQKNTETDCRTLGIIGIGRGAGVTHLTVWMANYLKSVCGQRTAVLEWNTHGDFERLGNACLQGKKQGHPFSILGVDYYAGATVEDWNFCMGRNYQKILVDFGNMSDRALQVCSGCDRKIVLGAFSEWRSDAFVDFLQNRSSAEAGWQYAAAFGSEEFRREAEKKCRAVVTRIPFSVDAFRITGADMQFFQKWM